jgi:hypothetical protein
VLAGDGVEASASGESYNGSGAAGCGTTPGGGAFAGSRHAGRPFHGRISAGRPCTAEAKKFIGDFLNEIASRDVYTPENEL